MPQSRDLFDDTTMNFGEHLEALRQHLWKALIGLVLCVVAALFVGDDIVTIVRYPIDEALQEYGIESEDNIKDFSLWRYVNSLFMGEQLFGSNVTNASLMHLQTLPNLEKVDLSGTQVTSLGLQAIRELEPSLQITIDPIAVAGLSNLRDLKPKCELNEDFELISLKLSGPEVTDDDITSIKHHTKLAYLDLNEARITDRGMECLTDLTQLKHLNLRETQITDSGLQALQGFAELERLDLGSTQITDSGLSFVKGLENLKTLNLDRTQVTNAGLKHLQKLKNLEVLSLSGPKITDDGMKLVAELGRLKTLSLTGTRISDKGLIPLKRLTQLRELNLLLNSARFQQASELNAVEAAGRDTIVVKLNAHDLAHRLHEINLNGTVSAQVPNNASIALQITAPEFAQFRDTSEKVEKPITLNVQEAFVTYLKVAFVSGLIMASPWVFYQMWLFVAAGLYPHERRYVYIFLPISIGLFVGGAVFCFFMVFPFVLKFLLGFNTMLGVTPQIRLSEWISFALMLPLMFGISFQLPLVMLFLDRISIFEVANYREKRRMAVLVIGVVSMLLTPADPMSMILMMIPLICLYELGILMCHFLATKIPFDTEPV